ncbi:hypothetical protein RA265_28845, partial [Pseudomonas syringae pv. tagetis]|uniref:hypothetical protein n=1 Tax=Pseudomonas syringae group genomosp. 7 TaxID=251699 RepID=UPI00376F68DD
FVLFCGFCCCLVWCRVLFVCGWLGWGVWGVWLRVGVGWWGVCGCQCCLGGWRAWVVLYLWLFVEGVWFWLCSVLWLRLVCS